MMKQSFFFVYILFFVAITSCEKDDICSSDTLTTPNMVIDFRDIIDRETLKNVSNIRVRGINPENDIIEAYSGTTVTQIIIPLINNIPNTATTTQFEIYKNYARNDNGTPNDFSDDFDTGNPDIISISYIVSEVFVSAACGFKAQYENVSITIEDINNTGLWLLDQEATLDNLTITNDTTTHYNLFH